MTTSITAVSGPRAGVTTSPTRDFRLLVVDDDLLVIRQLGKLLTGFAQVSVATGGEDALPIARTQQPDLILLDARCSA